MKQYLQRHKVALSLLCALALSLVWITAQLGKEPGTGLLQQTVLHTTTLPAQGIISAGGVLSRFWDGYIDLTDKAAENQALKQELTAIGAEVNRLREMTAENERLKKLLDMETITGKDSIAAAVIGRGPSNWYNTLLINRGLDDGVTRDMAVLSDGGLVGRVAMTFPGQSMVLLITDPSSAVGVTIQRTRENCILKGKAGGGCEIRYLQQDSEIQQGDTLVTSGLGGIYPKGIELARVTRVDRSSGGMFISAQAMPTADLRHLEEVMLTQSERLETGDGKTTQKK